MLNTFEELDNLNKEFLEKESNRIYKSQEDTFEELDNLNKQFLGKKSNQIYKSQEDIYEELDNLNKQFLPKGKKQFKNSSEEINELNKQYKYRPEVQSDEAITKKEKEIEQIMSGYKKETEEISLLKKTIKQPEYFAKGLATGTLETPSTIGRILNLFGNAPIILNKEAAASYKEKGLDLIHDKAQKTMRDLGNVLIEKNEDFFKTHPEFKENEDKFAFKLGMGASSLIQAMGASLLTGGNPIGGAAFIGLSQAGNSYAEAIKQGKSNDDAMKIATLSFGAEAIPEYIGLDILMKTGGKKLFNIIKKSLSEGSQEVSQQFLENIIMQKSNIRKGTLGDGLIESGLIGMILGGGASVTFDAMTSKGLDKELKEMGLKNEEIETIAQKINDNMNTEIKPDLIDLKNAVEKDSKVFEKEEIPKKISEEKLLTAYPQEEIKEKEEFPKEEIKEKEEFPKEEIKEKEEFPKEEIKEKEELPKEEIKEKEELPKEEIKEKEEFPKEEIKEKEEFPKEKLLTVYPQEEIKKEDSWKLGIERDFSFDPNSTENEGRFRLKPPHSIDKNYFDKGAYSIKGKPTDFIRKNKFKDLQFPEGIQAIVGKVNEKEEIQAIRFNKNKFNEKQAKNWFDKNKNKFDFYSKKIKTEQIQPISSKIEEKGIEVARRVDNFIKDNIISLQTFPGGIFTKKVPIISDEIIGTDKLKSINPEVETRFKIAKGIKQEKTIPKIKKFFIKTKETMRQFPKLNPKTKANTIDILRQYKDVSNYSKVMSKEIIRGIIGNLGPKKYDVFTRNIILPDLIKDINRNLYDKKELPFGYKNKEEIEYDLMNFKNIAEKNPDIKDAIEKRNEFMDHLKNDLVENGLLPKVVLEQKDYFHRQILDYIQMKKPFVGTSSKDVRTKKKGFQKARIGSSKDYNTEYVESEFEVIAQALSQLETQKILNRIKIEEDISDALKATAKLENVEDWKTLIPDGYITWQPKEGNHLYPVNSIKDKILQQILNKNKELTKEDIENVMAIGRKKLEWVVQNEVAETLDSFRDFKDEGILAKIAQKITLLWKKNILLCPVRFLKYNINNLSGDLDIVLSYDYKILKYFPQAISQLFNYHYKKKILTSDIAKLIKLGVIDSGLTINEIPEIKTTNVYEIVNSIKPKHNLFKKYWKTVTNFTQYRENLLRFAAYKYFINKIIKNPTERIYGTSNKIEIDQLFNKISNEEMAAKLARELVGDYGKTSQAGVWLSNHVIPFYRWMEVNAPRYVNLLKNLPYEGETRTKAITVMSTSIAMKLPIKAATFYIKAQLLFGLVNLWNYLIFPDETEKLARLRQRQFLILGKEKEDGNIPSIRFQGALSDALNWLALDTYPYDIQDLFKGKQTLKEKGKEIVLAPAQKVIAGMSPFVKTFYELLAGKSYWPDFTRPRTIRNKGEHFSRLFALDKAYKFIYGLPNKGLSKEISELLLYNHDVGQSSYYAIKELSFKFLKEKGYEGGGGVPTKKSNALFYYKQALKLNQPEKAQKFLNKYYELGGTEKGLKTSIKKSAPLGHIPKKYREEFVKNLDLEDKYLLKTAQEWYNKIYQPEQESKKRKFKFPWEE